MASWRHIAVCCAWPVLHHSRLSRASALRCTREQVMRGAPWGGADASRALRQALAEVHRANVAHLDLHPDHVFVARDGASGAFAVSLLDFSCACELGPSGAPASGGPAP